VLRRIVITVSCLLSFLVVSRLLVAGMDWAGVAPPQVGLDVVGQMRPFLDRLTRGSQRARARRVGVLGDSMLRDGGRRRQVSGLLSEAVRRAASLAAPVRFVSLAQPGRSPFDFYFLVDEIAEAEPDAVVLGFNVSSLSRGWQDQFAVPELAGWMAPRRFAEAVRLPTHLAGLTLDRMLLYAGLVGAGVYDPWLAVNREQARAGVAYWTTSEAVQRAGGQERAVSLRGLIAMERQSRVVPPGPLPRYSVEGARIAYSEALSGVDRSHPVLLVVGQTVADFKRHGVATLVYLAPVNVDHLKAVGVYDGAGIQRTVSSLQHAVESNGGRFVDLHDLLPNAGFRDASGHLAEEDFDGGEELARALAPSVIELLRGK